MTVEKDYRVKRGDDFILYFEFRDADGGAIDITGWELFATLKERIDDVDSDAVANVQVTDHTDAAAGNTKLRITGAELDDLKGAYYYDVQVVNDTGEIFTLISGKVFLGADTTRRTS